MTKPIERSVVNGVTVLRLFGPIEDQVDEFRAEIDGVIDQAIAVVDLTDVPSLEGPDAAELLRHSARFRHRTGALVLVVAETSPARRALDLMGSAQEWLPDAPTPADAAKLAKKLRAERLKTVLHGKDSK